MRVVTGKQLPSVGAVSTHDMSGGSGQVHYDLTPAEYDSVFTRFSTGYRVVDLRGYLVDAGDRIAVVFEQDASSVGWTSGVGLTGTQVTTQRPDAMRPVLFTGYASTAGRSFAWLWEDLPGPERTLHHDRPIASLRAHDDEARRRNKRIVDLSGYRTLVPSDRSLFTTIWADDDGRTEWMVTGPSDSVRAQTEFNRLTAEGWCVVRSSGWEGPEGVRYLTLWEQVSTSFVALHGYPEAAFTAELGTRDADGLRPEQLGPYAVGEPRVARYGPIWRRRDADVVVPALVADFARGYGLPAVSLAVARRGRLAYTHGFGELVQPESAAVGGGLTVDVGGRTTTIPEPTASAGRPVDPHRTLFRVASLSKTVTAAAVLRLVDQGVLRLDDPVFARGGALAGFAPAPADERVRDITVRHLLQHGSGGWSNQGDDPMWTRKGLSTDDLVRAVLAEEPLHTGPGTTFAYSNFGYCLLGRLLEAVSGRTYERRVRDDLLTACGVDGMRTARDAQPGGDVIRAYPAPGDEDPYQLRIDRMDAHGGWLATAVDMVRFAVHVAAPGVLSAASVAVMTTPSGLPGSAGYGAGWWVTPAGELDAGTWYHTGVLPGSAALLQRAPDDLCLVALTNTRSREPDTVAGLQRLLTRIRAQVDYWPLDQPL